MIEWSNERMNEPTNRRAEDGHGGEVMNWAESIPSGPDSLFFPPSPLFLLSSPLFLLSSPLLLLSS